MNSEKKNTFVTINAEEFDKLAQDKNRVVLDVRTPFEFHDEHIKDAILIPHNEIPYRMNELEPLRNKEILIYCHAGVRSVAACYYLIESGFATIYNLRGGIDEWTYAGKEVQHG